MKENHGHSEEDKIRGKNISPSTPLPPPPQKKKIGSQNVMAGRILETSGMAKEPNSGGKCSWVAVHLDICWIWKKSNKSQINEIFTRRIKSYLKKYSLSGGKMM